MLSRGKNCTAMKTFRKIALILLLCLGGILLTESGLRFAQWEVPQENRFERDGLGMARYGTSREGYGDLVPNQDGHWSIWYHRAYHVVTNSVGLRATEEPREGAYRILALGDSMTFGPYLTNEDTWPGWMETRLRSILGPSMDLQVFNAGVAGYSISDELALLREKGLAFRPDLVILAVFDNDIGDLRPAKRLRFARENILKEVQDETRYAFGGLRSFLGKNSALYNLASAVKHKLLIEREKKEIKEERQANAIEYDDKQKKDFVEYRERYAEFLLNMVTLLRDKKIAFVLVHVPSSRLLTGEWAEPPAVLKVARSVSEEEGTPLIELLDRYRQTGTEESLYLLRKDPKVGDFTGNGHLSRYGAQVMGFYVAEWLLGHD